MNFKDLTVIIPTLNEEKNISKLIYGLKELYPKISIIVVDDGSRDNTQNVVKTFKDVVLIDRTKEKLKGLTASVIDAIDKVKTDYLIVMDADLQHPKEKIADIYRYQEKGYDIVIATRERKVDWSLKRKIVSKAATTLGRLRLLLNGLLIIDPMSGYFGIKTRLAKDILKKHGHKFEKYGYKILFDFLKYTKDKRIEETYYKFSIRKEGKSKIGKKQVISLLKALFK